MPIVPAAWRHDDDNDDEQGNAMLGISVFFAWFSFSNRAALAAQLVGIAEDHARNSSPAFLVPLQSIYSSSAVFMVSSPVNSRQI